MAYKYQVEDYFALQLDAQRKAFLVNLGCEIHGLLENILKELQNADVSKHEANFNDSGKLEEPLRNSASGPDNSGQWNAPEGFKRGPGRPRKA